MLYIEMQGRLGNQMFQYASVRTLAEQRKLPLCYASAARELLTEYFNPINNAFYKNAVLKMLWHSSPAFINKRHSFVLPWAAHSNIACYYEEHDPDFYDIKAWTKIKGWFQSERYFAENRKNVLKWFTPRRKYLKKLNKIEEEIVAPVEKRCCIHLRRGDFKTSDQGYAHENNGWMLPVEYYKKALAKMPKDIFYIITSDEPDFAESAFQELKKKYISRGNPPIVDMFLMTRCRFNIISNSSFAWWGAWLNRIPDRVIIAPQYFIGWAKKLWFPKDIKTEGWHYIHAE